MAYWYFNNAEENLTLFVSCLESFCWTIIDTFFHVFEIKYSYATKLHGHVRTRGNVAYFIFIR